MDQVVDIEFKSQGTTIRGWYVAPHGESEEPFPCVIMAHGLGGTKRGRLLQYAHRFAAIGCAVVLFDYRYYGDSDGEPRQLVNPKEQHKDWHAAIAYVRNSPSFDNNKIILWGSSYGGGHSFVVGAQDGSVLGCICQCPMLDSKASSAKLMEYAGLGYALRLVGHGLYDLCRAALGMSPHYIPLIGKPGEMAAMSSEETYRNYHHFEAEDFVNSIAARLVITGASYHPHQYTDRIKHPVLIQICKNDSVVSPQAAIDVAQKLGSKATLIQYPIGHFDIYIEQAFETAVQDQVKFIQSLIKAS